jgi:hypothetical protein
VNINWNRPFQRFISEAYGRRDEIPFDDEDNAILSCLIVLHEAAQGKINLSSVAQLLIMASKSSKWMFDFSFEIMSLINAEKK